MQDAGDSPPDRQRSEGRKRRNFSAPRRIRPKPGTASDRRTPRSRCVWQALYPLSDCFSSGCFSECLSECLRNGCGTSRAAKAAWARQGGGVKCGKERQDAAVGAEIATVNSCGDQRGVSELRIGTNNRREGDCKKDYAGGVHGNRRGDLRGVSAQRIAREFASGNCVRRLALKFAVVDCAGRITWRG